MAKGKTEIKFYKRDPYTWRVEVPKQPGDRFEMSYGKPAIFGESYILFPKYREGLDLPIRNGDLIMVAMHRILAVIATPKDYPNWILVTGNVRNHAREHRQWYDRARNIFPAFPELK